MFKLIGDIHSRPKALAQALRENSDYSPIFLGDILDGRLVKDEETKTQNDLNTLELVLNTGGEIILGNHDYSLLEREIKSKLTANTNERLKKYDLFQAYKDKLRGAKTYKAIYLNGVITHIAHALPFVGATFKEQSHGIKLNGQRWKWFENYTLEKNVFRVCGHYHQITLEDHFCVLDGDTKHNNCLPVLLIDSENTRVIKKYYEV